MKYAIVSNSRLKTKQAMRLLLKGGFSVKGGYIPLSTIRYQLRIIRDKEVFVPYSCSTWHEVVYNIGYTDIQPIMVDTFLSNPNIIPQFKIKPKIIKKKEQEPKPWDPSNCTFAELMDHIKRLKKQ